MKSTKEYTESNRIAWNEAMLKHQIANGNKWDDCFAQKDFSVLATREIEHLKKLEFIGKTIAHPCCNNGVELMSLKNLGAGSCVGFDISDNAIAEASNRCRKFNIDCEFYQSDVYEINPSFNGRFDIVYISIGCFGWLPDLPRFLTRMSALLKSNGKIFIHELHPFSEMFPVDSETDKDPMTVSEPYFRDEPFEENDGIDYVGKTTYDGVSKYWFVWKLSDIINAIIASGFSIDSFHEFENDISATHARLENVDIAVPLSYILTGTKTA